MDAGKDYKFITKSDVKTLQTRVVSIYKEIKKICDEHGIRYFAIGGTAIGTIRHKGIIPWDDDIDLGMPREDYEKFKKLSHMLPGGLEFTDYSDVPDSLIVFGKVQDTRTCFTGLSNLSIPSAYYGIFVDIMPMDGMPSGELAYFFHRQRLKTIFILHNLIVLQENGIEGSGFVKRAVRHVISAVARAGIIDAARLKNLYTKLAKRYKFDESTYTTCLWQYSAGAGVDITAKYNTRIYTDYAIFPFEDTKMRMPIRYKEYLKGLSPDYMTPPPKEKQIPHHDGILDFKRSYLDYAEEARAKKMEKYV